VYLPGPYACPNHDGWRKAYEQMAARANLTAPQSIEQRYDFLRALPAEQKDAELAAELDGFSGGPPESLAGPERTSWFESLARETSR
jgi:hypothetical protein